MKKHDAYKGITITAGAAALMVLGMLIVSAMNNGVSAQDFESVRSPGAYASAILAEKSTLQLILTLDNLFLIFYTAAFAFIATAAWKKRSRILIITALGAILVTTFLDIHENAQLLNFVAMAENGMAIEAGMLLERAVLSQTKFMSSYLSFFLYAFVLPQRTFLERSLRWSLWTIAPMIGILVYTYPAMIWSLGRFSFMMIGLTIIAWNYWIKARGKSDS
jgi:hypothetical protein